MNDILVSVIVPVYKVERYLERCVRSVVNQTLNNIEIILVDDGSPDKCPKMCDDFAKEDTRIKVVHKQNGGLASARNAGLKIAKGKYILFVDSDDWIEYNTLEELVKIANTYDVNFVRFRPMYANWPGKKDGSLCDFGTEKGMKEGLYEKSKIIEDIYPRLVATPQLTLGVIVAAWRSLYNREFLISNNLYFDEKVKYSEDTIFSAKVVKASRSFYYLDGPRYYHYFYNSSSITKSFRPDRWESYLNLIKLFDKEFKNDKEYEFSNQLYLQKLYCVSSALGDLKYLKSFKEKKILCKKILNDSITREACQHLNLLDVSHKQKLYFILIKLKMKNMLCWLS